MTCDCTTAPFLPGADSYNLTIDAGEAVPVSVEWCAQVGTGAIQSSTWSVSPGTMTVDPQATVGTITSALITSTETGTLYKLKNTVRVLPLVGSVQTYAFTIDVYVRGALSLGCDGLPCADTPSVCCDLAGVLAAGSDGGNYPITGVLSFNGVALTATGSSSDFLAADGQYHPGGGGVTLGPSQVAFADPDGNVIGDPAFTATQTSGSVSASVGALTIGQFIAEPAAVVSVAQPLQIIAGFPSLNQPLTITAQSTVFSTGSFKIGTLFYPKSAGSTAGYVLKSNGVDTADWAPLASKLQWGPFGFSQNPGTTATRFTKFPAPNTSGSALNTADDSPLLVTIPGTVTGIMFAQVAGTATDGFTATLTKNGVDTALVISVPAGGSASATGSIAVVAGDKLSFKINAAGTIANNGWNHQGWIVFVPS